MSPSTRRLFKALAAIYLFGGLAVGAVISAFLLYSQVHDRRAELESDRSQWNRTQYSYSEARERWVTRLEELKSARLAQEASLAQLKLAAEQREAEEARKRELEGLSVCNYTSASSVDVAFVTWQSDSSAWMGHGWYAVKNGACRKILSSVEGQFVYLYAEAGNRTWGGDLLMCTTSGPFTLMEPGKSACRGGTQKRFKSYTPTDRSFTWRLLDG